MRAQNIRTGHKIGRRTVVKATTGTATFTVARSSFLAPARLVKFDNGATAAYEIGTEVAAVGYAEPVPAGGVASRHVTTPPKIMASARRVRGESVHGMSTRAHDMIARTNMFDVGRVNGTVGASRNGVGSTVLTGPSF